MVDPSKPTNQSSLEATDLRSLKLWKEAREVLEGIEMVKSGKVKLRTFEVGETGEWTEELLIYLKPAKNSIWPRSSVSGTPSRRWIERRELSLNSPMDASFPSMMNPQSRRSTSEVADATSLEEKEMEPRGGRRNNFKTWWEGNVPILDLVRALSKLDASSFNIWGFQSNSARGMKACLLF